MNIFYSLTTHFEHVQAALHGLNQYEIEKAVQILTQVRKDDAFVWLVGNGGSASTCSHFANDLEKMAGIRSISIPDMTPGVLAHGNDEGWENMFSKIIQRNGGLRDVVVAISCSGNSANVVRVAEEHNFHKLIVLTGDNEKSILAKLNPDALIMVPDRDIKVQEDVHLTVCHAMAGVLCR